MIHFSCICGQVFDLPEERAGDSLQCPACLRLVDVPPLDEINAFEDDGTLKMKDAEELAPALKQKIRTHAHRDDLRQSVDEYFALDDAPGADAAPNRLSPRYDPETGELVQMVDVVPDARPPAHEIPVAKPALNYSSNSTMEPASYGPMSWWRMPLRIVSGGSLMAITFVFLLHLLAYFVLMVPIANFFLFPFVLLIVGMIIAHYGNVMEEIGPTGRDDVPVLLRHVSFTDDIWHPLVGLFVGFAFAFLPAILLQAVGRFWKPASEMPELMVALVIWGLLIFPAAGFTAITSGALQNMRPRYVFAVIRSAPGHYALVCIAFILSLTAYLAVLGGMAFASIAAWTAPVGKLPWGKILLTGGGLIGLVATAIYLMHLATAWMGLLYRTRYDCFNWVYQKHEKKERTDALAQLQEMRRRGDPRVKRNVVDPARLQQIREAEAARQAAHAQSMRKI